MAKKSKKIFIKPENKGKFTKKAKAKGKGVQEYAEEVNANPKASAKTKKQAVFAANAKKWKKGGKKKK
jgi:hypothetical protein